MRFTPKPTGYSALHRGSLRSAGFTLLEIMVVIAIMGLLAGLAISKVTGIFDDAEITTTQLFVKESMKTSLFNYRVSMGDYPSTAEGLQALVTPPGSRSERWRGPYISGDKVPLDRWGEPYQYTFPGVKNKGSYDIWSKGRDKQSGTADDIGNWDAAPTTEK